MKRFFKWVFRLILVLLVLLAILVLCRDAIAKKTVERRIRTETGMNLAIGRVQIGLRSPTITVQNLTLMNTAAFGGSRFLDVAEVHLEYDPASILSRKVRLKLLRVNIGEVHIVQNKDGKTNLQALRERQKQQRAGRAADESQKEFEGIGTLRLTLGRFKYTSYKDETKNQEIWIGAKNETATDVKSAKDLQPLITKIALEKGARLLAESLLDPGANANGSPGKEGPEALDRLA